jgi:hypothetical protein
VPLFGAEGPENRRVKPSNEQFSKERTIAAPFFLSMKRSIDE